MTTTVTRDCFHSQLAFDKHFRHVDERRDISPVAKLCHGALVSLKHANLTATQVEIAAMKGLTRHQVWNGLQELKAAGLIAIIRIGLGQANEYTLLSVDPDDLRPGRKQASGRSDSKGGHSYRKKETERKSGYVQPTRYGDCQGCGSRDHRSFDCPTYGHFFANNPNVRRP